MLMWGRCLFLFFPKVPIIANWCKRFIYNNSSPLGLSICYTKIIVYLYITTKSIHNKTLMHSFLDNATIFLRINPVVINALFLSITSKR